MAIGCLPVQILAGLITFVVAALIVVVLDVEPGKSWFQLGAGLLWFLTCYLVWEGPRWVTAIRNRFRECPNCGARDWDRPHWGGFGL